MINIFLPDSKGSGIKPGTVHTITRALATQQPNNLQTQRDLTISLINVARLQEHTNPGQALTLYEEALTITRALATQLPGNIQALWDVGVAAARIAQLLPPKHPDTAPLWAEAATSFRTALCIQPDHQTLARMSFHSARNYADCDPPDRDEWLAYAAELAERFGFEK